MSDIPIIGTPNPPPTYPQINVQFMPNGALLIIQLGPTTSINQFMDGSSMDMIEKGWRENKKQAALLMQAVQNSRN